jgi:hypothetical protein
VERRSRRSAAAALGLLATAYAWLVFSNAGRSVGGSDSSGYYNAARALAAGRPLERIEPPSAPVRPEEGHLFIPLGYVLGREPGTMATFYPPGLPLHFVAAAALAGWDLGPFLVSPLASVASLLLLYFLARELALSRIGSLAAVAMFAAVPVFSFFAVQLMSDVVAAAWAIATILLALKSRRHPNLAFAAGFAFGVGVLVRPTSAILVLPLFFAFEPRPRIWASFVAGGAPCAVFLFAFDRACYGGFLKTGYAVGGVESGFAWANFPERFRHYVRWISAMMSPLVPAAWLLLGADGRRPLRTRLLLISWFGGFLLLYCFYGPYEAWWYTRFLLPGIPALPIAAVMLAESLLSRIRARAALRPGAAAGALRAGRAAAAIAFLVVCFVGIRLARRYDVLDIGRGESIYPDGIRWASARVPKNALVVAMQFSGAMKAYHWGKLVRWDWMEEKNFPEFRQRMEAAGYVFYALTFPQEIPEMAAHLPGTWKPRGSYRQASLWELR